MPIAPVLRVQQLSLAVRTGGQVRGQKRQTPGTTAVGDGKALKWLERQLIHFILVDGKGAAQPLCEGSERRALSGGGEGHPAAGVAHRAGDSQFRSQSQGGGAKAHTLHNAAKDIFFRDHTGLV